MLIAAVSCLVSEIRSAEAAKKKKNNKISEKFKTKSPISVPAIVLKKLYNQFVKK